MKIRQNFVKLTAVAALLVGSVVGAGEASAQSYGTGMTHHSEHGYTGASGHLSYGDIHSNQAYGQRGPSHWQGQHGYHAGLTHAGLTHAGLTHAGMKYTGGFNDAGHPTGALRPGMVLPDGAIVISVGN